MSKGVNVSFAQLCAEQDANNAALLSENVRLNMRLSQVCAQLRELQGLPEPAPPKTEAKVHPTVCLMCNRGYGEPNITNKTEYGSVTASCGCNGHGQLCANSTLSDIWCESMRPCGMLSANSKCYKCRRITENHH